MGRRLHRGCGGFTGCLGVAGWLEAKSAGNVVLEEMGEVGCEEMGNVGLEGLSRSVEEIRPRSLRGQNRQHQYGEWTSEVSTPVSLGSQCHSILGAAGLHAEFNTTRNTHQIQAEANVGSVSV